MTFSRHMPPAVRPRTSPLAWLTLCALAAILIVGLVALPILRVLIGLILAAMLSGTVWLSRRERKLRAARAGEDIGTFARSFDRRSPEFDPHVVRATWDALQNQLDPKEGSYPLRAADRLEEDLGLLPEDVEDAIIEVIARAGRSSEATRANPVYGHVVTVADFVRFATHQPGQSDAKDAGRDH